MRELVESMGLGFVAIVVAVVSTGLVWLLCSIYPVKLGALWVVIVPFVLSYCLYWLPVWLGADPSEFSVWAVLGVGVPFLAGFFPSAVLALILEKRAAKKRISPWEN